MKIFTNIGTPGAYDITHIPGNKDIYTLTGSNDGSNDSLIYENIDRRYIVTNGDSIGFKDNDDEGNSSFKFTNEYTPFNFTVTTISDTIENYISSFSGNVLLGRTPASYFTNGTQYITSNSSFNMLLDAGTNNKLRIDTNNLTTDGKIVISVSDDNSTWSEIAATIDNSTHQHFVETDYTITGRYIKFEGTIAPANGYWTISSNSFGANYAGQSDLDIKILKY